MRRLINLSLSAREEVNIYDQANLSFKKKNKNQTDRLWLDNRETEAD